MMKFLKLHPWEKKLLKGLAIASSIYLGLVFIGVIPVHCDAYTPPLPPHEPTQTELYAASSKAVEQVFCNPILILTGTTGKAIATLILFILFVLRPIASTIKKLRKKISEG